MLNIVIFGAPGSGKGTQSELIIKEYGLDHISTGDVLRAEIKNGTELGKTAKGYIDQGQLIPDEFKTTFSGKHEKLAAIPLISYNVTPEEIKKEVEQGYFFMKINIMS